MTTDSSRTEGRRGRWRRMAAWTGLALVPAIMIALAAALRGRT